MKSPILSPELNFATFSEFRSHISWFDSIGPLNFAMISKFCSEISHAYYIGDKVVSVHSKKQLFDLTDSSPTFGSVKQTHFC